MPSPKSTREVQKLTGRIAALNRFILRSTNKCLPFFKLLKGNTNFKWNDECQKAVDELKRYLSTPLTLTKPLTGEKLFLYFVVMEASVSAVLVRDSDNEQNEQRPVFYISKSLLDTKTRYPIVNKLALALVTIARKFMSYFQSHSIMMMMTYLVRAILHSSNKSKWLTKWAVKLNEFNVEYQAPTCLKSQVLVDFVADLTPDV